MYCEITTTILQSQHRRYNKSTRGKSNLLMQITQSKLATNMIEKQTYTSSYFRTFTFLVNNKTCVKFCIFDSIMI